MRGPGGDEQHSEWVLSSATLQIVPSRDAIRAVNLVRMVDQLAMLPMAMYLCTLLPIRTLVDGTKSSYNGNHRMDTLARDDQFRCIEARLRLAARLGKSDKGALADWCPLLIRHVPETLGLEYRHNVDLEQKKTEIQHNATMGTWREQALMTLADTSLRRKGFCGACEGNMLMNKWTSATNQWATLPEDVECEAPPHWDATLTTFRMAVPGYYPFKQGKKILPGQPELLAVAKRN